MAGRITKIVNLTPQTIVVESENDVLTYPSEGIARVTPVYHSPFMFNNVKVKKISHYESSGIPDKQESGYIYRYVVTSDVKAALHHREDLLVVDYNSAKIIDNILHVDTFII